LNGRKRFDDGRMREIDSWEGLILGESRGNMGKMCVLKAVWVVLMTVWLVKMGVRFVQMFVRVVTMLVWVVLMVVRVVLLLDMDGKMQDVVVWMMNVGVRKEDWVRQIWV